MGWHEIVAIEETNTGGSGMPSIPQVWLFIRKAAETNRELNRRMESETARGLMCVAVKRQRKEYKL